MLLFFVALIVFIIVDVIIRYALKHTQEKKLREERANALETSINIDFSKEAKSLKRVEVENPKAKILCVDDESVILDSFRKILVLDGYSVDTVESGGEALNLIKDHHYDFCFTDLKMPEMDGVEVTKTVKHLRPDIDVIIITGYATVQTAVDCMKFGAMDYVEKPFTEDELLEFVKKSLYKRKDRIEKQLKPQVRITHMAVNDKIGKGEFAIPGGVFIAENHTWASLDPDGNVRIGIDDFAKKMIGKIDKIEFPNLGMEIKSGQPLFTIKQGNNSISFSSPVSGTLSKNNSDLTDNMDRLEASPYEMSWISTIDANNLDNELTSMKIGNAAVNFYQEEINNWQSSISDLKLEESENNELVLGIMEKIQDKDWKVLAEKFFK